MMLGDVLNRFIFVYIDDILIFTKTVEEHIQQDRAVLLRLCEHSLFVKAKKCKFHSASVSFLGYVISPGNIQMDPAKVSAVLEWPVPHSRKQLQQFLSASSGHFVRNYSFSHCLKQH